MDCDEFWALIDEEDLSPEQEVHLCEHLDTCEACALKLDAELEKDLTVIRAEFVARRRLH